MQAAECHLMVKNKKDTAFQARSLLVREVGGGAVQSRACAHFLSFRGRREANTSLHYFLSNVESYLNKFYHSFLTQSPSCSSFLLSVAENVGNLRNLAFLKLNLLEWHWLIKSHRFQVYNSIKHHLHTALSSQVSSCPHLSLLCPLLPLSTPLSLWLSPYCCLCVCVIHMAYFLFNPL